MKKFFGALAFLGLMGCFAGIGALESDAVELWQGAALLLGCVIAFGVFALAAQSCGERPQADRATPAKAQRERQAERRVPRERSAS